MLSAYNKILLVNTTKTNHSFIVDKLFEIKKLKELLSQTLDRQLYSCLSFVLLATLELVYYCPKNGNRDLYTKGCKVWEQRRGSGSR